MGKKKERSYFMVINTIDLNNSAICRSKLSVANTVGMHVNSIKPDKKRMYKHYLVIQKDIQ